jgi:hypothetical protein
MSDEESAASGRRQALTAIVPVLPGQVAGLEAKLLLRRNEWVTGLRGCGSLHFAKLSLVPALGGAADSAGLLFETTFDGGLGEHLGELWDNAGGAYADLLRPCEGGEELDRARFHALIERHTLRVAAACSAHAALPRAVVDNDAQIDRLSQAFLDRAQQEARYRLGSPLELVARLREHLEATEQVWLGSLELSATPRADASKLRLGRAFARFGFSNARAGKPDGRERRGADGAVQSSTLLLAPARRGRFQRWALGALLADRAECGEPDPDADPRELARVHAARWVVLADGRLLFSLTHDGAAEAFRARLPAGAPSELWLPTEAIELYPQIWYSAYPDLSVNDVLRNHRIRELLARPLDAESAGALCAMF